MKKKVIICCTAILLILIGILTLVVLHNKKESSSSNSDNESLISELQKALDETIMNDENIEMPLYLSALKEKTSCEVVSASSEDNGTIYSAIIKVTYADVSETIVNYLEEHSNDSFDEDRINKDIAEIVSKSKQDTSECEITFICNNDTYTPIFTEEIINKMYGGIYSAYYDKLDKVATDLKGSESK